MECADTINWFPYSIGRGGETVGHVRRESTREGETLRKLTGEVQWFLASSFYAASCESMHSEGRNTHIHFLTCLFPGVSTLKVFSDSGQTGRNGGRKQSSGRCRRDGRDGGVSLNVCIYMFRLQQRSTSAAVKKGAAMAMTCGQLEDWIILELELRLEI